MEENVKYVGTLVPIEEPLEVNSRDDMYILILNALPTGAENAIKANEISALLNIDKRLLRHYIEKMRNTGIPVCSSTSRHPGLYLPADSTELRRYTNSRRHRDKAYARGTNALIMTLYDMFLQENTVVTNEPEKEITPSSYQ